MGQILWLYVQQFLHGNTIFQKNLFLGALHPWGNGRGRPLKFIDCHLDKFSNSSYNCWNDKMDYKNKFGPETPSFTKLRGVFDP